MKQMVVSPLDSLFTNTYQLRSLIKTFPLGTGLTLPSQRATPKKYHFSRASMCDLLVSQFF